MKNYRLFPLTSPPASQSRLPTPHGPRRLDRRALPDHAQPSGPGPALFTWCVSITRHRTGLDSTLLTVALPKRQISWPRCPFLNDNCSRPAGRTFSPLQPQPRFLFVCVCVLARPASVQRLCPPPLLQEPRVVETFPGSTTAPNQEASGSVTSSSIASCKPPANRIPFQPPIPFILFSFHRAEPTASARLGCSVVVVNSSNHAPGRNPLLRAMLP